MISALTTGLVVAAFATSLLQVMELKTRDSRFRVLGDQQVASSEIVVVEIDGASIKALEADLGRWPWPRDAYVEVLEYLEDAGARAVAFDVQFTERNIAQDHGEGDQIFATATRQVGNVVHVMVPRTQTTSAPPSREQVLTHSIAGSANVETFPEISFPYAALTDAAMAVGHVAAIFDSDGPWRRYLPVVSYQDRLFPSLALVLALHRFGLNLSDLELGEREIIAGPMRIPLDQDGRLPIWYNGGPGSYSPAWESEGRKRKGYSFIALLYSQLQILEAAAPLVPPDAFRDKIVLIGVTEPGLHDVFTTPYSGGAGDSREGLGEMAGVEIHAHVLDSLLHNRHLIPLSTWKRSLLSFAVSLAGLVLIFNLGLFPAILLNLVLIAGYMLTCGWLFSQRLELPVLPVAVSWILTCAVGLSYQYWVEGTEKRRVKQIFSKFVSRDVYQRLLQNPEATELGGQRSEVTVLFSDLRGFTSMSEGRSPEDVVSQLNEYFTAMVAIVFEFKGTIDKFVGDMIMALFNAPLADPLHADNALRCAMDMQRKLVEMNETWQKQGLPTLHCGVGLNSGEMVAGIVGADTVRSYTVIGDNVNLGARIESLCKEYKSDIIISEFTKDRLQDEYPLESLGEVVVKGKSKPVGIFRVNWKEWSGRG